MNAAMSTVARFTDSVEEGRRVLRFQGDPAVWAIGDPAASDQLDRIGRIDMQRRFGRPAAQQIDRHGLGATVTLLGPRTQAEVIDLLRWADVFAAPCLVGVDGNADGLPTVLLEAMAMGVPCIASDVTGIPEVITNGGISDPLSPAGDGAQTGILIRSGVLSELVEALQSVSSEAFDRHRVALAARRVIDGSFDSHRQSARLRELVTAEQPVRLVEEAVAYS